MFFKIRKAMIKKNKQIQIYYVLIKQFEQSYVFKLY